MHRRRARSIDFKAEKRKGIHILAGTTRNIAWLKEKGSREQGVRDCQANSEIGSRKADNKGRQNIKKEMFAC